MTPIDELELQVFADTGDLELAQELGDVARRTVRHTAVLLAHLTGTDPEQVAAEVERQIGSNQ